MSTPQRNNSYYTLNKTGRYLVDHKMGWLLIVLAYLSLPIHLVANCLLACVEGVNDWKYDLRQVKKAVKGSLI